MLGAHVAMAAAGLGGIRLLTELAPRSVFGQASLFVGALGLGRMLFVGPVSNTQLRLHAEYVNRGHGAWFTRRMSRYQWLATLWLIAAGLLAYALAYAMGPARHRAGPVVLGSLAVMTLIDTAKTIRINRLNAERRQARGALFSSAEAILLILAPAAFLYWRPTVESYVGGLALAGVLTLGAMRLLGTPPEDVTVVPVPPGEARRLRGRTFRYGLPFVPMAVVNWVANLGDRYVIGGMLGSADVGLYAAAYSLGNRPFNLTAGVFNGFARPILFDAAGDAARPGKARRIFLLWMAGVAVTGALGLLAVWVLAPWVARLLLAPEYRARAPAIIQWVGLGYLLYTTAQVVESRMLSLHRSAELCYPTIVTATVNIAFDFVLVPRHGIVGAAQATAIAFACHLLMVTALLSRRPPGAGAGLAAAPARGDVEPDAVVAEAVPAGATTPPA